VLAEVSLVQSLGLTLPLWPLLSAVLVGLTLWTGKLRRLADKFVIAGTALSAVLGLMWFMQLGAAAHGGAEAAEPGAGRAAVAEHAAAEGGAAVPGEVRGYAVQGTTYELFRWISLGEVGGENRWITINYFMDPLTGIMLVVVTVIATMVIIYSTGYMRDHHGHPEVGYERFFAWLGLFVFSMLMLVLGGNFILLYLGWEAVGLCSYLLIGFYYLKPAAAAAAKKAFLVNRIGDFGFALGLFFIYRHISPHLAPGENPFDYAVVFRHLGHLTPDQVTTIALLLLCGAVGKSAQVPLYVWLPDAMEGPSPVSALIHAATMVTAGVYMLARCGPIYSQAPFAQDVVVAVGVIGALFAATMALAQYDMKRILAYSTMSQLAFMFTAAGCAAPDAGVFHLYTHGFFKALLFLTAGNVMHAMGNVIDVRRFGGLKQVLPVTYVLMLIGCLALAGFPLLSGFWSKDAIVHAAFARSPLVGIALLVVAFMTAYYTFRMFFLCFHGPLRLPEEAGDHPHEMPPVMNGPLVFLAIGSVLAGYYGVSHYLEGSTIVHAPHHEGGAWLYFVSAAVALAGIGLAWVRYGAAPTADPDAAALGGLWKLWNAKYYVDEIYDRVFVKPLYRLGQICFGLDNTGIDGLVWFAAAVPRGLGAVARVTQSGALQAYAMGMMLGLVALVVIWRWLAAAPA
jgi:NADH-quinone oxidoreductase subunit L